MLVNHHTPKAGRFRRLLQASLLLSTIAGTTLPAFAQTPLTLKFAMIIAAEIGLVTPPVGLNCFVVSKYSKMLVSQVFRGCFPYVLSIGVTIALLLVFPQLVLWLPANM